MALGKPQKPGKGIVKKAAAPKPAMGKKGGVGTTSGKGITGSIKTK